VFYVVRPLVEKHPDSDRPLIDATFKNVLEEYLVEELPGWDVLRGARGVFKEPHRAKDDSGLAMSTMNVRNYLQGGRPSTKIPAVSGRFPTHGAENRIAAVLICEKEGFDELLSARHVPERFDLALMSTKGISAIAARDLARSLSVPCFTLHDLDKNGFVMAGGFPFATDLGLHLDDVHEAGLRPEDQPHRNRRKTYRNLLHNGASDLEAEFIADGQRVELNMFTGPEFLLFVEGKLREHGVEKVLPGEKTLAAAWQRAHRVARVNRLIESTWPGEHEQPPEAELAREIPPVPEDLADQIREVWTRAPTLSWDDALCSLVTDDDDSDREG
jgi:hypothetical protein